MLATIASRPVLAAIFFVAVILSPLLLGVAPVGGDPELLYRPIKAELARALAAGQLPFWSNRFGLGTPLAAESHVAAFYPPNWLFYRLWNVETAFRLTMWLHFVALAAATFAYARTLGNSGEGSALAAVSFALCGFQAVHAVHEPFYHVMPYLPLCLLAADRYATAGRPTWLAVLALAWGTQILLGHFQIQAWTAGLVLATGAWRSMTGGDALGWPRQLLRIAGLAVGLLWGAAIACVQLRLTWELTSVTGFIRSPELTTIFPFPTAHWAQFALPEVFLGRPMGAPDAYWGQQGTWKGEACAYGGVVPFILAFVGFVAAPRDRALTPWRLIVPLSLALATMPRWWPDAFFALMKVPGLGWFRAPARYTLLTSLGLALLAGRGLDRSVGSPRFGKGLARASVLGAAAWGWSIYWASGADFRAAMGADTLPLRFTAASLAWGLGFAGILAWRRYRLGAWAPLLVTALELGGLFYSGSIRWGRSVDLAEESPMLRRLAEEPAVGLVGGRLLNLPVDAGLTTAYPTLGIPPPAPNYLLQSAAAYPLAQSSPRERRWQRRFGVTHAVWGADDNVRGTELLAVIDDPVLDRVLASLSEHAHGPWKLVRNPFVAPAAWVAPHVREASSWGRLYTELSLQDAPYEAWFLPEDRPSSFPSGSGDAEGRVASVESWDGRTAIVTHDGPFILVLRRAFYPGWSFQLDGGAERPVLKVNGGLQGVPLVGSKTSRITLRYRPSGLAPAATVTCVALCVAVLGLCVTGCRAFRGGVPREA